MNKLRLVLTAFVAVLILAFILQLRVLQRIHKENAALRQQLEQAGQLAAENERLSNSLAQAKSSLAEDQKLELLRLRGEAAGLRRQTNEIAQLQEDNRRLRQALATRPKPNADTEEPPDEARQMIYARMNDAKKIVLGMIMHAGEFSGQVATNLDRVNTYLTNPDHALTGTNEFDFIYTGNINLVTNPSSVIVIRERQARPTPEGWWAKAYGFADGHAELHAEADGNFETWEKARWPRQPSR